MCSLLKNPLIMSKEFIVKSIYHTSLTIATKDYEKNFDIEKIMFTEINVFYLIYSLIIHCNDYDLLKFVLNSLNRFSLLVT